MSRFKVSVSSDFEQLWRYNIVLVCELCSAKDERIDYTTKESWVASVGSNLEAAPSDYSADRRLSIATAEGEYINVLIYVLPHTLPTTNDIIKTKPFSLIVTIAKDDNDVIVNQVFSINQWSGDNIALNKVGLNK